MFIAVMLSSSNYYLLNTVIIGERIDVDGETIKIRNPVRFCEMAIAQPNGPVTTMVQPGEMPLMPPGVELTISKFGACWRVLGDGKEDLQTIKQYIDTLTQIRAAHAGLSVVPGGKPPSTPPSGPPIVS